MSIQIYNSMTKKKETFVPLKVGEVKMYVCGPTVYDYLHVGNFRGATFFNMVRNWLEVRGFNVTYVYNYTDVDDKIINRAIKEGKTSADVSEFYIDEFKKDYQSLGLRPHTHNPKVTEYMQQIIDFVAGLIEKGRAYEVNGDVYFDVHAFPEYGKLSHKNLEDLEAGHRIAVDERKKHVADFALWKKAKDGEPSWPSPWSNGRPGWHIECSAMIKALLGDQIDIHGGGLDLIFPHHENEVAQSEGLTDKPFVKYWMHNNMLEFGSQKMSKSLGNVRTYRSFVESYNPELFKYLMLSAHYRSTIDFSDESIQNAATALHRIYSALNNAQKILDQKNAADGDSKDLDKILADLRLKAEAALDDDFNSAIVLACIFDAVREFNARLKKPQKKNAESFLKWVKELGQVMALFQEDPQQLLGQLNEIWLSKKNLDKKQIEALVQDRWQAKQQKDFAKADALRDQLLQMGIRVLDRADGSDWEVNL